MWQTGVSLKKTTDQIHLINYQIEFIWCPWYTLYTENTDRN